MKKNVENIPLPTEYKKLLSEVVDSSCRILTDNLTGIYLHGSAAMGCFNPQKSDLDLIFVVEAELPDEVKMEFMQNIIRLNEKAPEKGIEMSVVRRKVCTSFVYPTPFELHFSMTHLKWYLEDPQEYVEKMRGVDLDLAAHFTIIHKYGIVLSGAEIRDVFGPVPEKDYLDSIWCDIKNAQTDILMNPIYVVLNLCRVLAYTEEKAILSKKGGGQWALGRVKEKFESLIIQAIECYESDMEMNVDADLAGEFAADMLERIKEKFGAMSKLIILRGNSGSGKTTVAKKLQRRFGRNTMVISQDVIRREMLMVKDGENTLAVPLMKELLIYGSQHSDIVILEGIMHSEWYRPLFELANELYGENIYSYYYDLPFEETLRRHQTKACAHEFGEAAMRDWWREKDFSDVLNEKVIFAEQDLESTVDMIFDEVTTGS